MTLKQYIGILDVDNIYNLGFNRTISKPNHRLIFQHLCNHRTFNSHLHSIDAGKPLLLEVIALLEHHEDALEKTLNMLPDFDYDTQNQTALVDTDSHNIGQDDIFEPMKNIRTQSYSKAKNTDIDVFDFLQNMISFDFEEIYSEVSKWLAFTNMKTYLLSLAFKRDNSFVYNIFNFDTIIDVRDNQSVECILSQMSQNPFLSLTNTDIIIDDKVRPKPNRYKCIEISERKIFRNGQMIDNAILTLVDSKGAEVTEMVDSNEDLTLDLVLNELDEAVI